MVTWETTQALCMQECVGGDVIGIKLNKVYIVQSNVTIARTQQTMYAELTNKSPSFTTG